MQLYCVFFSSTDCDVASTFSTACVILFRFLANKVVLLFCLESVSLGSGETDVERAAPEPGLVVDGSW